MANLSNINGKFVVEQTTGYVGVGTTDPDYPIEVLNASAEIALNATGGSIYRVQSDSASNFIIRKAGVGDRLVINSAGNATFAGNVSAQGGTFTQAGGGVQILNNGTAGYNANLFFGKSGGTDGYSIGQGVTANDGVFRIYNNGTASVPLAIADNNNSTFAGTISAVGASTFILNDGVFIKAVNGTNNVAATNVWGYGLYEGTSKLGEISLVRDGSNNQMYMGTTGANQVLRIGSANKVTALTIDASQNSTFAGNVDAGGRLRSGVGSDSGSQLNLWANSNGNTFLAGYNFAIYTGSNNARTQSFIIDHSKNATFAGNVGIGVAAHGTASLNITNTDQHIRLNNGSELGVISLDTDGKLDLWAHGTDETINFRTGTGSGTVTMSVVGEEVGIGTTLPDFALDIEVVDSGVQLQIGRTNTNVGSAWMGASGGGFSLGIGAYGVGNSVTDPKGFLIDASGNLSTRRRIQAKTDSGVGVAVTRNLFVAHGGSGFDYTFDPVALFGAALGGGKLLLEVTGWPGRLNCGYIVWRNDGGGSSKIGTGVVSYVQTAVQSAGNVAVSLPSSTTNEIKITFTGWHTNDHGWSCYIKNDF